MPTLANADRDLLLAHCRSKTGVEERGVHLDGIQFSVLSGSLDFFATFYLMAKSPYVLLRCDNAKSEQLKQVGASVRTSAEMRWSGPTWKWTDVTLDGTVPVKTLTALIDESYDFAQGKFSDTERHILRLLARRLPPRQLLSEMIDSFGLQDRKTDIEQLLLPALRLKTTPASEAALPIGRSKIGGRPDLPETLAWPTFRDKRPLSFLAQINLAEPPSQQRLAELPPRGFLYVFSIYGWQSEDSSDPDVPQEEPGQGWTQILFHDDADAPLARRSTPKQCSEYPAAAVTFHPTLCLPISVDEPSVVALKLDKAQADRFDEMNSAFTYVANYETGPRGRHLLLGYADWVQYVADPVRKHDLRLLFQLASDANTQMGWGDGGNIYAFVSKSDLKAHRFSDVTTEYQCG